MQMAREFGRPDWRAMLAGISSTEYADWRVFYRENYFHSAQIDAHFSTLIYSIFSMFSRDTSMTPDQFSLLSARAAEPESEPDDNALMAAAEGISGGVRYGPASG
ncbi:phage tail assembly protein T [Salmonella enterica subsp. enterica serovar Choleraesuis]|nr:phage tail assembly protein T [Salmonella enterica subsp. enterica serovar Choleraesuis]